MTDPTYTVWITTGDEALGGTDSNVYVMLYGTAGQTDWIFLPTEDILAFEQGATDRFVLVAPDVGDVTRCCLAHDSSADSGWQVASVRVQHNHSGKVWDFGFNQWIGQEEAGRLVACAPS